LRDFCQKRTGKFEERSNFSNRLERPKFVIFKTVKTIAKYCAVKSEKKNCGLLHSSADFPKNYFLRSFTGIPSVKKFDRPLRYF